MIIVDLKLALFLLLVFFTGLGGICWRMRQRSRFNTHLFTPIKHLLEPLPFGMILLNAEQQIIFANTPAQTILATLQPDTPKAPGTLLHQVGILTQTLTPRSGRLSQPVPIRWWCYPLEEQHALLALFDETDQQRTLRQQHVFINHLLHELRTPLTALVAHIEIMRTPQISASLHYSALETIQRETQRLTRLVRDMLELYRLETSADLPLQPTDLVLVAEDAIASVILQAEARGQRLAFDTDTALPRVLAHPDRLRQVFVNLLDNAIKYCRPCDTIRVYLEAQPEGVVCSVQDNGPGIAVTDLPHVTEQLYRGRTDIPGIGMGLALANTILRQHHATLRITSTTDGTATGTTCRWTLLYATPPERPAERSLNQPDVQTHEEVV